MNILYLPNNIASMPAITALGVTSLPNVNAIVVTQNKHKYLTVNKFVVNFGVSRRNPIKWLINKITFKNKIRRLIKWADVIHYFGGPLFPDFSDVAYCQKLRKPIFVEWVGSDIRNPEILRDINLYYSSIYNNGYEYSNFESSEKSITNQKMFASFGAIPLLYPEMSLYVDETLFERTYLCLQRQDVLSFTPFFPDKKKMRPLIIHSPSAPFAKGTNLILEVVEELRGEYEFDFKLLTGLPREELLVKMSEADVYVDQMICGSYGMAATEAMSMGKPVVSFIMPEVFDRGLPKDCPIIFGDITTLKDNLIMLIKSANLRNELGIKSREFAVKFHDTFQSAERLMDIYRDEISVMKKTSFN